MKNVPAKSKITTAELQLSELCALVETLPYWTVVDKVMLFKLCFGLMEENLTKFHNFMQVCW
jgi:hypothetical protein